MLYLLKVAVANAPGGIRTSDLKVYDSDTLPLDHLHLPTGSPVLGRSTSGTDRVFRQSAAVSV